MTMYAKTMRQAREEMLAINEAKYDLYHKDFSSAMQHAYKMAKKLHGITIDPKEIDDKVATGPSKPGSGKTNSYRLKGDKGAIQVQVYNKGGSLPFELNMYKEEVELDEGTKQILAHGGKGKYKVTKDGDNIEIKFGGKVVGTADFDSGADSFFVSIKGEKGQKSFDDAQAMVDYFAKNKITEEVELDEDIGALIFGGGIIAALLPVLFMAVREIIRGTPLESSIKKIVDKLKKNKNYKMSDSEKSDVKGFVSKVKKEKPSLLQKVMKQAKLNLLKDEVDLDEAEIDPADIDTSATDDDIKAADKNIMMQLRKSVSLRGQFPVEFLDKKKIKIPQKIAQAALTKYSSLKKPMDKEKFQSKIAKSHRDLLMALKESNEKMDTFDEIKNLMRKLRENNNG